MRATEPAISETGAAELKRARHPLLPADRVVPIDLRLGGDFDTLVVTGPNTGGKTVAIKTLGLLSAICLLYTSQYSQEKDEKKPARAGGY